MDGKVTTRGLVLELTRGQLRLANDRLERSTLDLIVIGNGDRNGGAGKLLLHDNMTASLSNFHEAMTRENLTDLSARECAEFRQRLSQGGL
jgi:hypothetical protein